MKMKVGEIMNNEDIFNVMREYENNHYRIEEIFFDSVLEETIDQGDNPDPSVNKMKLSTKLKEKVSKLIQELTNIVQKAFLKFSNNMKNLLQTNKGFTKMCRDQMVKVKPLEAIKLISYEYNPSFLDQQVNLVGKAISDMVTSARNDYNTAKKDNESADTSDWKTGDTIIKMVLNKAGVPDNVTDLNLYFGFLKEKFRGKKSEQLFKGSLNAEYYRNATAYNELNNTVEKQKTKMFQEINTMKTDLNRLILASDTDDRTKQVMMRHYKNLTHLFNFFTSFMDIYLQLRIEMMMSYRTVMKKLYQF